MDPEDIRRRLGSFPVQLGLIIATLALYILTQSVLFGFLVALEFAAFVGMEFFQGTKQHGWKKEIAETAVALAIAVAIWFGLGLLLHTPSPISAIVSCSMLPEMQRGDMVMVSGESPRAPLLTLASEDIAVIRSTDTESHFDGKVSTVKGSTYSYCAIFGSLPYCSAFLSEPERFYDQRGKLRFNYGRCGLVTQEGVLTVPCVTGISVDGKEIRADFSNDVIIYTPEKGSLYSAVVGGDIIHRVYAKFSDGKGNEYYLTKGDNNNVFDAQAYDYGRDLGNGLPSAPDLKGKVIARVPYVGYLKLLVQGYFTAPGQCATQLQYAHA